jgi:hypothetical protein
VRETAMCTVGFDTRPRYLAAGIAPSHWRDRLAPERRSLPMVTKLRCLRLAALGAACVLLLSDSTILAAGTTPGQHGRCNSYTIRWD